MTHTPVDPANIPYLRWTDSGSIHLCIRDLELSPDDALPAAVYKAEPGTKPTSARYFVSTCMIVAYGRYESSWPELARRFVFER